MFSYIEQTANSFFRTDKQVMLHKDLARVIEGCLNSQLPLDDMITSFSAHASEDAQPKMRLAYAVTLLVKYSGGLENRGSRIVTHALEGHWNPSFADEVHEALTEQAELLTKILERKECTNINSKSMIFRLITSINKKIVENNKEIDPRGHYYKLVQALDNGLQRIGNASFESLTSALYRLYNEDLHDFFPADESHQQDSELLRLVMLSGLLLQIPLQKLLEKPLSNQQIPIQWQKTYKLFESSGYFPCNPYIDYDVGGLQNTVLNSPDFVKSWMDVSKYCKVKDILVSLIDKGDSEYKKFTNKNPMAAMPVDTQPAPVDQGISALDIFRLGRN